MDIIQSLFDSYDVYLNALMASVLISYASAPIGVFLNLKRMTLMGEAISHSLLPGFALAFMFYGMSYFGLILGGLFAGVLVLSLMMGLNRFVTIKEDGVLTVVYLTFSAVGVLIVLKSGVKVDLSHVLIGNILMIDRIWLVILLGSSIVIRAVFGRIQKKLLIVLMDPEYARFLGISVQRTKSIFYFLVLWILVLCFYSVGTLLSLGLLLVPALIGKVLTRSIDIQIRYSLYLGIMMAMLGLVISVGLDWPTGPTIIVSGGMLFLLSAAYRSNLSKLAIVAIAFIAFSPSARAAMFGNLQPRHQVLLSTPYLKLFLNHLIKPDDKVSVESLIPYDQSIHNYQLKPSDIKKIKQAKIFLYIGNGLEETLKEQVSKANAEVKFINLIASNKAATTQDIHFWLSPEWASTILESLKSTIISERSDLEMIVEKRFSETQAQLAEFTKTVHNRFRGISNHTVLISHNSLYYLRDFLGIDLRFYTSSANPGDVISIKKLMKNKNVTLLKEYGAVNFLLESLIKENKRQFGGEVYGEIIPFEFFDSKNYIDILKMNIDLIHSILKK